MKNPQSKIPNPKSFCRLFIFDIDGCLSVPYRPYRLDLLQELARLGCEAEVEHAAAGRAAVRPRITLCSGRPYPYVEAMTQALDLYVPVIFEGGGGMFHLPDARVTWNPAFSDDLSAALDEMRQWLIVHCLPGTSLLYDYGKRTHAGIVGPVTEEVMRLVPVVEARVADSYPALTVFHTPYSIDVVPAHITKAEAVRWLVREAGYSLSETAFIGDANGDLGALQAVGYAFAPENAAAAVKAAVSVVTRGAVIEGALEAYRWCIAHNRARRASAAPGSG